MEYESYQVQEVKAEPRYGRRDGGERNPYNENYRRRSPGKTLTCYPQPNHNRLHQHQLLCYSYDSEKVLFT